MRGPSGSGSLQRHSRAVLENPAAGGAGWAVTAPLSAPVRVTCARMAEQEPTAEQLAQIAAENEEDEHSVNYKPPAQKSIQEIQELDKDDESLRKYKEALLGAVTVNAGEPGMCQSLLALSLLPPGSCSPSSVFGQEHSPEHKAVSVLPHAHRWPAV